MSLSPQSRTYRFLSTLSLRRATRGNLPGWSRWSYFYPRSPCGERHLVLHGTARNADISIHALLAESDSARVVTSFWFILFLSTLSLRRATAPARTLPPTTRISIHALLAESDFVQSMSPKYLTISIHALLAESDWRGCCRRGTLHISIHALLAESDSVSKIQSRLRL